jgi:hypothetical protein
MRLWKLCPQRPKPCYPADSWIRYCSGFIPQHVGTATVGRTNPCAHCHFRAIFPLASPRELPASSSGAPQWTHAVPWGKYCSCGLLLNKPRPFSTWRSWIQKCFVDIFVVRSDSDIVTCAESPVMLVIPKKWQANMQPNDSLPCRSSIIASWFGPLLDWCRWFPSDWFCDVVESSSQWLASLGPVAYVFHCLDIPANPKDSAQCTSETLNW